MPPLTTLALWTAMRYGIVERFDPVEATSSTTSSYSTVTVLARLRGWSTLRPRMRAIR